MYLIRFAGILLAGILCTAFGILLPGYLRAVDEEVIRQAGATGPSIVEEGHSLLNLERIGPARMYASAAELADIDGAQELASAVGLFEAANPDLAQWGGSVPYLQQMFAATAQDTNSVVRQLVTSASRATLLEYLTESRRPGVQEILKTRQLKNTVIFPPVSSPSGQALDTAILLAGLLSQGDHFTSGLRREAEDLAGAANRGYESGELEAFYLDVISLGRRMNWLQMTTLLEKTEDIKTLREVVHYGLNQQDRMPVLFVSVAVADSAGDVTGYLKQFSDSGVDDLTFALSTGVKGLRTLLVQQRRIHRSSIREGLLNAFPARGLYHLFAQFVLYMPLLAVLVKYGLFLTGGFCLARVFTSFKREPGYLEAPLQVEGMAFLRQQIMAFMFLALVIIFGEPYLTENIDIKEAPLNWRFPIVKSAIGAEIDTVMDPKENEITIIALVIFLMIQGLIYSFCLVKLKEIRRQRITSKLKLKLLDNEENMFDSGLYVGLGGTVLSLVLLAFGIIEGGRMAAYSSTLFGIIFVAILKIFHVRPFRRKLIIESENRPI